GRTAASGSECSGCTGPSEWRRDTDDGAGRSAACPGAVCCSGESPGTGRVRLMIRPEEGPGDAGGTPVSRSEPVAWTGIAWAEVAQVVRLIDVPRRSPSG